MIPPEPQFEGSDFPCNAAGYRANYALLEETARETTSRSGEAVEYVELSTRDRFNGEFKVSMSFSHRDIEGYPSVKRRLE